MNVDELDDRELARLHARVRECIERGEPLNEDVRRYGIRDLTSLRKWILQIEDLLEKRGVPYHGIG